MGVTTVEDGFEHRLADVYDAETELPAVPEALTDLTESDDRGQVPA